MRRRIVQGGFLLGLSLLAPACDWHLFFDGVPPDPGPTPDPGFPFALQIPVDGQMNVIVNPTQMAWTTESSAIGYWLQISTVSDFSTLVWDEQNIPNISIFLGPTLTNATTFYWRVYAQMPGGGTVLAGGSPYHFRTEPGFAMPTSFSTWNPPDQTGGLPLRPSFRWNASEGALTYTLLVSTSQSMTPLVVNQPGICINQAECPVTLAANTTYWWEVQAVGTGGTVTSSVGGIPGPLSFTTAP